MTVYVEMTEEEAARRYCNQVGLAIVDWVTFQTLVDLAPKGMLVFDVNKITYKLSEGYKKTIGMGIE